MKGLLLKDLYMIKKYCRFTVVAALVMVSYSIFFIPTFFLLFYPCFLAGTIPVILYQWDDESGWSWYSSTMPYTKGQIVSGKYLIGLGGQFLLLVAIGTVLALKAHMAQNEYVSLMILLACLSLITSSSCLPFMFRFGSKKGSIVYYTMHGIICGGCIWLAPDLLFEFLFGQVDMVGVLPWMCLIAVGAYALSWFLSFQAYRKREF